MWTLLASGIGATAWAWHRDRQQKQAAERLAAATLEALLNAVDANDAVTGQHMRRTAAYALCLAEAIGLSELDQRKVERVALFHDIGKIHAALFDIVHDETQLNADEREQIATHPERGAEVLAPLEAFYPELTAGVLSHHERWDGTGYPHRLKGDAIPLFARIVAIVDTFDAITHSRRYHAGEGLDRATAIITEGRGTQFDPALTDLFVSPAVSADVRRTYDKGRRSAEGDGGDRPKRPAGAERRAQAPESPVPDVRFRWRAPSSVSSAGAPGADGPAASA